MNNFGNTNVEKIFIKGKNQLKGNVSISGAKNAALPLMALSLIINKGFRLSNIPDLADTRLMASLLTDLGVIGFLLIVSFLILISYKSFLIQNPILSPFLFIFIGEFFPFRTTGSFFTTFNATFIFLLSPLPPKWRIQYHLSLSLAYRINLLIPSCSLKMYSKIFKMLSMDKLLFIAFVISKREFNLNSFNSNFS